MQHVISDLVRLVESETHNVNEVEDTDAADDGDYEHEGDQLTRHLGQMQAAVGKLIPRVELHFNDCSPSKCWVMVQSVFQMLGNPCVEFVVVSWGAGTHKG